MTKERWGRAFHPHRGDLVGHFLFGRLVLLLELLLLLGRSDLGVLALVHEPLGVRLLLLLEPPVLVVLGLERLVVSHFFGRVHAHLGLARDQILFVPVHQSSLILFWHTNFIPDSLDRSKMFSRFHDMVLGGVFDQRPYYRSALRTPLLSKKTMRN